jgi:hypothetical protein
VLLYEDGWSEAGAAEGAFRPTVFTDLGDLLEAKLALVARLGEGAAPAELAAAVKRRAAAWGAVAGVGAAEALMLLRERA